MSELDKVFELRLTGHELAAIREVLRERVLQQRAVERSETLFEEVLGTSDGDPCTVAPLPSSLVRRFALDQETASPGPALSKFATPAESPKNWALIVQARSALRALELRRMRTGICLSDATIVYEHHLRLLVELWDQLPSMLKICDELDDAVAANAAPEAQTYVLARTLLANLRRLTRGGP